jgi:hypothetical protein
MLRNLYEIYYLLGIVIMSLAFPSLVSAGFFLVSFFMVYIMTKDATVRFRWGKYFLIFKTAALIAICIWKSAMIKTVETTDKRVYDERRRFYESLGFALVARRDYHEHPNCNHFAFDVDMSASFLFEGFLAAISLLTALYYWVNAKRIDYLTDPDNQEEIQEYKDLINPPFDPR